MFDNLLVLDKNKRIIFDKINMEEFCSEEFVELLAAFDALISGLSEGELSNVEWGEHLITFKKRDDVLFVACCAPTIKQKKINEDMDRIISRFFNIYSTVLIEKFFNGDRSVFENSEERFNNFLEEEL